MSDHISVSSHARPAWKSHLFGIVDNLLDLFAVCRFEIQIAHVQSPIALQRLAYGKGWDSPARIFFHARIMVGSTTPRCCLRAVERFFRLDSFRHGYYKLDNLVFVVLSRISHKRLSINVKDDEGHVLDFGYSALRFLYNLHIRSDVQQPKLTTANRTRQLLEYGNQNFAVFALIGVE